MKLWSSALSWHVLATDLIKVISFFRRNKLPQTLCVFLNYYIHSLFAPFNKPWVFFVYGICGTSSLFYFIYVKIQTFLQKKLFRKTERGCHLHDTKLPVKYRVNKTISEGFNFYACTKQKNFLFKTDNARTRFWRYNVMLTLNK